MPRLEPWPSPAGHEEEGLWPTPRPPPLLGPLATPEMLAREAREQAGGEDERGRIGPPLDDAPPPGASDPALDEAVVDGADGAPSGEGAEVDGAAAAPDGPDLDDVGGVERSVPQEALAPQAASLPSEPEVEPSASDAEPLEPEAAASDPGAAPAEPEPLEPEAAASDLGAAPSEPPSIDLELFTVERSAVVRAALDCRPDDASQILEDHQLEPSHLRAIEAHWQAQIRAETRRGKSDLLRRRDDAYVAQLEEERGPITADEFAALVIAAERGGAAAALERLRLPSGASLPIERVFLRRVTDDPRLREQIRFAIEEARRQ